MPGAVAEGVINAVTAEMLNAGLEEWGKIAAAGVAVDAFLALGGIDAYLLSLWNVDSLNGDGIIPAERSAWAYGHIIARLNAQGRNAATAFHWTYLSGVDSSGPGLTNGFDSHGICDQDRWFRQYDESKRIQGNEKGAFHPNYIDPAATGGHDDSGHGAYFGMLYSQLSHDLLGTP
jgi:hypothetical protein